jgi:hypothetical protein
MITSMPVISQVNYPFTPPSKTQKIPQSMLTISITHPKVIFMYPFSHWSIGFKIGCGSEYGHPWGFKEAFTQLERFEALPCGHVIGEEFRDVCVFLLDLALEETVLTFDFVEFMGQLGHL